MAEPPRLLVSGTWYELVHDGKAILCYGCGATSWHPKDVAERYCGMCHVFHEPPRLLTGDLLLTVLSVQPLEPPALLEIRCVGCGKGWLTASLPLGCRCGHRVDVEDYT